MSLLRFNGPQNVCPICRGHDRMPRGQGERCYGYRSSDGRYAHCTRSEFAGGMHPHQGQHGGNTYAHRLEGACKCGVVHREELPTSRPNRSGNVVPLRKEAERKRVQDDAWSKYAAIYEYEVEEAAPRRLARVCRTHEKQFHQALLERDGVWRWGLNGARLRLYRQDELELAVSAGDTIYLAEGEKDCDRLHAVGQVATCNSGGAGKFPREAARHFKDANVVIVADRDEQGRAHAKDVAAKLECVARDIRIVEAASGKDAADHLAADLGLDAFRETWAMPTRDRDPVAWKRRILLASIDDEGEAYEEIGFDEAKAKPEDPNWSSGFKGAHDRLPSFHGVTILNGKASSAKTIVAIGSSVEAARTGTWDVLYLAAEMGARDLADRVERYCDGAPPVGWRMLFIKRNTDLPSLVERISERLSRRRLLVVFDSVSSFAAQSKDADNPRDPYCLGLVRRTVMWALNTKRETYGDVSFLLLSEQNARGETAGRIADHKADLVVAMETDPDDSAVKLVTVVKGWKVRTGPVGRFLLDWRTASLSFAGDAPEPGSSWPRGRAQGAWGKR